jgi:hypothetical protein
LWSDDLIRYNNSYRRRFKDVYRYFSDNNIGSLSGNKTEIFPLFSARHSAIEPNQPHGPRDHLGLYLSNTGANGFTGSLGGAEITFREFSENIHNPHGCDFTSLTDPLTPYGDLYINVSAPTNNSSTSIGNPTPDIYGGSFFELSNVVLGESYEITSLNHSADYLTVRYGTSDGDVVQYGTGNVRITASKSGTYYVHIARNGGSSCLINGSAPLTQREIEIRHINSTHYPYSDPIFWSVNEFDNVINGYCWYRYSELGGLHPRVSPFKKKENELNAIEEKLEEKVNIFPNPAKDLIQLSGINEGLFEFYDISGKHIFGGQIMNAEISTQNL